jgi:two-component system nitrogen regulation sensor histidine kinase GlnL
MTFLAMTGLINFITSFCVGIFILVQSRRSQRYIGFISLNFSIAIFSFAYFFWQRSQDLEGASFWFYILFEGILLINFSYLYFVFTILGEVRQRRREIFLQGICLVLLSWVNFTHQMYSGLEPRFGFGFWPKPTSLFSGYLVFWLAQCFYGFYLLFNRLKIKSGIEKIQIEYLLIAFVFGFAGGASNWLVWLGIAASPMLNILVSVYVVIVLYAILRFQLIDVRLVVVSTLIFIFVYAIALAVPLYLYKMKLYLIAIVAMAVVSMLSNSIYLFLQRKANMVLLKDQRKYQHTLIQASSGMSQVRDLQKLLKLIVRIVMRSIKPEICLIYFYDKAKNAFVLGPSLVRARGRRFPSLFPIDSMLVQMLSRKGKPLIISDIVDHGGADSRDDTSVLLMELELFNAELIVPSVINHRMISFLVLGRKSKGSVYTTDDVNVFTILANQSALAIENAQFYEEVQQSQEQLFHAEKLATIGTMADGLAHQINNRFHVMGLIAGDMEDSIGVYRDDPAKMAQDDLLQQLSYGLKKISENVAQGGAVVKGLLNYSRQEKTSKDRVDLSKLVNDSLQMVALKVKVSDLEIVIDFPSDAAYVHGNFVQLQEVLFNIIDNAYFSMMEKKKSDVSFTPRLSFTSLRSGNRVVVRIEDNGMGIREEDQKKLFTPFFTTKVSSRNGNGLGLFVMQKIIKDDHGGSISFQSEYTRGVTITITLFAEPETGK